MHVGGCVGVWVWGVSEGDVATLKAPLACATCICACLFLTPSPSLSFPLTLGSGTMSSHMWIISCSGPTPASYGYRPNAHSSSVSPSDQTSALES